MIFWKSERTNQFVVTVNGLNVYFESWEHEAIENQLWLFSGKTIVSVIEGNQSLIPLTTISRRLTQIGAPNLGESLPVRKQQEDAPAQGAESELSGGEA